MSIPGGDDLSGEVSISPAGVTRFLSAAVVCLVLLHIVVQAVHFYVHELPWLLREIFDLDEEESFGTWFSAVILFVAAVLLFVIAHNKKKNHGQFIKHWYGLAFGFMIFSIDEVAGMHETFNTVTDFAWTIPAAFVTVGVVIVYWKFLTHLPESIKKQFIIAGVLFVSGGLVVEHLADFYIEAYTMKNFGYHLLIILEETMEMAGVIIFIRALLLVLVMEGCEKLIFKIQSN
ncbi:hypothetical protein UZ36_04770 [Candidatus Nitromaritima sp. SCGC AAA799-C22]|nr:hypothetical protein UZ36_04770 [Candidatus Nitromaritima sp. SCGC AAA799-C22]